MEEEDKEGSREIDRNLKKNRTHDFRVRLYGSQRFFLLSATIALKKEVMNTMGWSEGGGLLVEENWSVGVLLGTGGKRGTTMG